MHLKIDVQIVPFVDACVINNTASVCSTSLTVLHQTSKARNFTPSLTDIIIFLTYNNELRCFINTIFKLICRLGKLVDKEKILQDGVNTYFRTDYEALHSDSHESRVSCMEEVFISPPY